MFLLTEGCRAISYDAATCIKNYVQRFSSQIRTVSKVNNEEFVCGSSSAPFGCSFCSVKTGDKLREFLAFTGKVAALDVAEPLPGELSERVIAGGSRNFELVVMNSQTCKLLKRLPNCPEKTFSLRHVKEWNHEVHVGSLDEILVYDLVKADHILKKFEGAHRRVRRLDADISRSILFSFGDAEKCVKLWSHSTLDCISTLSSSVECISGCYAEDRQLLFVGGAGFRRGSIRGVVEIWDVRKTGEKIFEFEPPNSFVVIDMCRLSAEVFASVDNEVALWGADGKIVSRIEKAQAGFEDNIYSICTLGTEYDRPQAVSPPLSSSRGNVGVKGGRSVGNEKTEARGGVDVPLPLLAVGTKGRLAIFRMDTGGKIKEIPTGLKRVHDVITCGPCVGSGGFEESTSMMAIAGGEEVDSDCFLVRLVDTTREIKLFDLRSSALEEVKVLLNLSLLGIDSNDCIAGGGFKYEGFACAASVVVWNKSEKKEVLRMEQHRSQSMETPVSVIGLFASPSDRKRIVSVCRNQSLVLWDLERGLEVLSLRDVPSAGIGRFKGCAMFGNEQYPHVFSGWGEDEIRVSDVARGLQSVLSVSAQGGWHELLIHPSNPHVFLSAHGSHPQAVTDRWDIRNSSRPVETYGMRNFRMTSVGAGFIASRRVGLPPKNAVIWNADTLKELVTIRSPKWVAALACCVPFQELQQSHLAPPGMMGKDVATMKDLPMPSRPFSDEVDSDDYAFTSSEDEEEAEEEGEVVPMRHMNVAKVGLPGHDPPDEVRTMPQLRKKRPKDLSTGRKRIKRIQVPVSPSLIPVPLLKLDFLEFDRFDTDDRLSFVGRGTFGDVFRVQLSPREAKKHDVPLEFAAKRMLRARVVKSMGGEAAFLREVHTLAMCDHQNVVRCLGYSVEPLVIIFELLHKSVQKAVVKTKEFPNTFSAKLFAFLRTCEGLAYLVRKRKLQHRDLKWENVMTTKPPNQRGWDVKLIDFGTAKVMRTGTLSSSSSMVIGTPHYVAPERSNKSILRGSSSRPPRSAIDVYSFGVMMYALLTGDFGIKYRSITSSSSGQYYPPQVDGMKEFLEEDEQQWIVHLTKECVALHPLHRPRLSKVLAILREKVQRDDGARKLLEQCRQTGEGSEQQEVLISPTISEEVVPKERPLFL